MNEHIKLRLEERIAQDFAIEYNLSYKCQIKLEGTILELLNEGTGEKRIRHLLTSIYKNYETDD